MLVRYYYARSSGHSTPEIVPEKQNPALDTPRCANGDAIVMLASPGSIAPGLVNRGSTCVMFACTGDTPAFQWPSETIMNHSLEQ